MAVGARRILLIEDNPDDVELTIRALKQHNLANAVDVARDGEEALELLFNGHEPAREPPALVLLDLKLPKVDGHEILRRIRANDSTRLLPVVILTSSSEEADLARGYAEGTNGYVRKPVDFDRFVEVVHELGLYWLVVNEPPPGTAHAP